MTAEQVATIKSTARRGAPKPVSAAIVLTAKAREEFGANFDFYLKYGDGGGG